MKRCHRTFAAFLSQMRHDMGNLVLPFINTAHHSLPISFFVIHCHLSALGFLSSLFMSLNKNSSKSAAFLLSVSLFLSRFFKKRCVFGSFIALFENANVVKRF